MRFLHTSDWHLGRRLHGVDLLEPQQRFLDWLVTTAATEQVDLVVVAGDVYDRAVPPPEAVALLDRALTGLAASGVPVLLTAGNHDSAVRLGFGAALAQVAGVHLRTRVADLDRPVLLSDEHGDVAVYGIPYLHPDATMAELGAERSHHAVLTAALARIRDDAAGRGVTRTVVAAHAFVTGAAASDSERDIRVGGIGEVDAAVFAGIDYVALGHLHRRQHVRSHEGTVRYCGSPLAYSFSERDNSPSVELVELGADGTVTSRALPAPVPRRLREVRGTLEDLLGRATTDLADCRDAWLRVVLTDAVRPHAPLERLRTVWPHTLVLDFAPGGSDGAPCLTPVTATTDAVELCTAFVEHVQGGPPDPATRQLLREVVEHASADLEAVG